MMAGNMLSRVHPAAVFLVLSSVLSPANAHALPPQTRTIEYRELNVQPWPLATAAPLSPGETDDLLRRALNTVCGYVGGDPALPATCSAGSHCAVDVEHGAVGCCPDGGSCTQGIFTDCVDSNSGPQMELNPYVFTCKGSNVCYKNAYDGGFFQYGCGSASDIATSVVNTASGKTAIALTTVSADLTATATTLSEPTTLGTKKSTSSTKSSTAKTDSSTSSSTSSKTSSSSTTGSSTTKTTSTASATTESATSSSTSDATEAPASNKDESSKNTGAIVGGTISGVAVFIALVALGIWLWRRKKGNTRKGPGPTQDTRYVSPVSQIRHNFVPLASSQEAYESNTIRPVPEAHTASDVGGEGREGFNSGPEQFEPNYPYGYGPGSTAGGIAALGGGATVGGGSHLDTDEIPLTRKSDDYAHGYGHALDRIEEDEPRPETSPHPLGPYRPRGDGGGSLWQQNRGGSSRNLTWI